MADLSFFRGKRVLVTGHTGFKGTWLCHVLRYAEAEVTGFSLPPPTTPSLYELTEIGRDIRSIIGDVRDLDALRAAVDGANPEIVLHLAAQPIVREGYRNPVLTYETNVMGTVNLLECIRMSPCIRSVVNVTTDKVYRNREWHWGYRENDELNGFDPYSNSKSCSELVTCSFRNAFFSDQSRSSVPAISTARAGNVIGGGDFAADRIIPDCIRAVAEHKPIIVRNPYSTRPYQHVLEPLFAYLMIAERQCKNSALAGCYNVGPDDEGCFQTGELVDLFVEKWGDSAQWVNCHDGGPHEAGLLKLDCSKLKTAFGWKPRWTLNTAVEKTVEWNKCWLRGDDVNVCMKAQIEEYLQRGVEDA